MKATGSGYAIGKAIGSWDPSSGQTSVMVFISPGFYPGPSMSDYVQNGGNATLSGLTVGGTADFNDLNTSGTAHIQNLQVMTATVSGNLTVLGLTSLVDLQISGHIITAGNAPTIVSTPNAGQNAACSVSGNDTAGQITITTGTTNLQSGVQCSVTFAKAYANMTHPVISTTGGAGVTTDTSGIKPYLDSSSTGFDILFNSPDSGSHTYIFNYFNSQ